MNTKFFTAFLLTVTAFSLAAQNQHLPATNATALAQDETNAPPARVQHAEQVREACLQGRRMVCGKILKVLPGGLVVDSGYTNLLRPPWNKSWLISGSLVANRPDSLVEGREPGSVCVGVVLLTDIPKSRGGGAKPRQYDYVSLLAYPTGQSTYNSVGTMQKSVRRYSANLIKAVNLNLETEGKAGATSP